MKISVLYLYEHVTYLHQLTAGKILLKRVWNVEIIDCEAVLLKTVMVPVL